MLKNLLKLHVFIAAHSAPSYLAILFIVQVYSGVNAFLVAYQYGVFAGNTVRSIAPYVMYTYTGRNVFVVVIWRLKTATKWMLQSAHSDCIQYGMKLFEN